MSSLVASTAATAQISGTLSVANTLIKCTTSGQYTDIEQCCTVASILIQNTPQYFKWPHIVSTASKHSNSCVLRNFSEVN